MAVDTAAKRRSIAGWPPAPDGTIDAGDRRQIAGWYRGIAAVGSEVVDVDSVIPYLIPPSELAVLFELTDGVELIFGSQSTRGHYEQEDEGILGAVPGFEVVGEEEILVFATGMITGLVEGSAVTVDGLNWRVRGHPRVRGGGETVVKLAKA